MRPHFELVCGLNAVISIRDDEILYNRVFAKHALCMFRPRRFSSVVEQPPCKR